MRILAVDDDPFVLALLGSSRVLGDVHKVTGAPSGDAALALLAQDETRFDIFLLDIYMDGMDGIALCAAIRAMPAYRATPIIMITAGRDIDLMQRAFNAGATDFVSKPFDGLELGTRVQMAALLTESLRREEAARADMRKLAGLIDMTFSHIAPPERGILRYLALENRLLSEGATPLALRLFAVELVGGSPDDPARDNVETVGRIVAEALTVPSFNLSYVGMGRFAAVSFGRARIALAALEADINRRLAFGGQRVAVRALSNSGVWTGRSAVETLRGYVQAASLSA